MQQKIIQMLEDAKTLPVLEKIKKIETAIILAEDTEHLNLAYKGRLQHVAATIFAGRIEIAFDSFGWCLNHYYNNQDTTDPTELIWQYKWIVNKVDSFLSLSYEEIDYILESMRDLYTEHDISLRPYYQKKQGILLRRGDLEGAKEYFGRWMVESRDEYSDCIACEENERAYFLLKTGKIEEALRVYEPILKGVLKCEEVPHLTYSKLILPLYLKGEKEKARKILEKAYPLISNKLNYIGEMSYILQYLALSDPKRGIRVLERHISFAEQTNDLISKFYFYLSSWLLLQKIEDKKIKYEGHQNKNKEWFMERTIELQKEFDARNRTTFYKSEIEYTIQLAEKAEG